MDFALSDEHRNLQRRCLELAADFATRAAEHDRDASHPVENYRILHEEGLLALNVPKKWGGAGVRLLGHTIAFEALAQGCPSTALAFNMHASVVMPILDSFLADAAPEPSPPARPTSRTSAALWRPALCMPRPPVRRSSGCSAARRAWA